ncbi:Receptor-type tyrosine-protein phosphatase delta [Holothuria leucospilota]|uniref:protein-tyrosine-phosphatase n=1 Tax=Holothuria leucospilota TaxID=206669 RepID=A0A9Q1HCD3_HOLLE|nr:Receptor-type tyrosine-protein phosphatase delta [Holothuria leucospilota]
MYLRFVTACGGNRFGYTCDKQCSTTDTDDKCITFLFCLAHPFGCRCNTGFKGLKCDKDCSSDTFGASCLQPCHCKSGQCDRFTGSCEGSDTCEDGWTGDSCQECDGNSFGPQCSQDCHCTKEACNVESGLCKTGGCLAQWVDQYPPYSCQTGLTNITYIKKNPGIEVPFTCTAVEGPGGDLNDFGIYLSRNPDDLENNNISAQEGSDEGMTKTQTFLVKDVEDGDEFYCQLRKESTRQASLGSVVADVYELPKLSSPPVNESVNGTSITISWSAWNEKTDAGDPPVIGYIPYYKKLEGNLWISSNMTSADTLMFTANGLDPETSYSFSVSAVRDGKGGEGPKSEELNVSTICDVPPGPQNANTRILGERQELVEVFWELPTETITCSSGITEFTIYYTSSETKITSVKAEPAARSYILHDLTVGMSYTIYVTLSTSGGESDESNHAEHLVPDLPTLTDAPLLTNATCTSITMVWDKWTEEKDNGTPPISHYIPYHRVNESSAWVSGEEVDHIDTYDKYQFTFESLTEEWSYEFCVVAVREGYGGEGDKNNVISGNTTACPVDQPSSVGLIVGSSIGGIFFIILIVLLVVFGSTKRQRKKRPEVYQKSGEINQTYIADQESDTEDDNDEAVYTNLEKPVPIPVVELERYLQNCGRFATLEQQFSLLNPEKQFNSNVGEKEENKPKNRFKNMIAYDHSRVVLEIINDDPYSDYYNANYIRNAEGKVAFVASQGPNKASVDDFWRMVLMVNVRNIVMLTNVVEGGKDRCFQYWPSVVGETKWFGNIGVTWEKEEQFGDYDIRHLHLQLGNDSFEVTNWHFRTWPDKDVPHQTTPLIEFCNKVKTFQEKREVPLLVHCSAGVGRTGTFIALYSLTDVVKKGENIDIYGFVEQMREDRINMVQKESQYKFLHECLLEVFLTGDTKIPVGTMPSLDVSAENIKNQFQLLAKLNRRGPKPHVPTPEESEKMRYPDITPVDKKLPFLGSPGKTSSTSFINACLVTSYRMKDAFIATQSPLPNTTEDFWRLVYDWRSPLIIMLNQLDTKDKTCCKYWPDSDSSEFGYMTVKLIDKQTAEYYIHRQFDVKHALSQGTILVHQLQLTFWDTKTLKGIIDFINDVNKLQKDFSLAAPTVIHCKNGVGRTGVFLTVASELDRLHTEGNFDIFNTVRRLRGSHPYLVHTQEDYQLCHQLLKLECPESQYANI